MTQSDYMINNPTETMFEDVIAAYLAASPLYNLRTSADFDINRMCDPVMLRQFIEEGQPETWAKLSKRFGTEALEQVIREYNRQDKPLSIVWSNTATIGTLTTEC